MQSQKHAIDDSRSSLSHMRALMYGWSAGIQSN